MGKSNKKKKERKKQLNKMKNNKVKFLVGAKFLA